MNLFRRLSNPVALRSPTWRDKAHAIIGELSRQSYEQSQRTAAGGKRKRHVPYSIPETAQRLVEALGRDDEETAKSIMMHDYDARRTWEAVQARRSSNPASIADTRSTPAEEVLIVVAWVEEEVEVVRARRTDLGEAPVTRTVSVGKAVVWLRRGGATDVEKARAYALPEGKRVFTYPKSEKDPLGRARREVVEA